MAGQVAKSGVVSMRTVASNNATVVSTTSVILRGWAMYSKAAAEVYVKFYDLARLPDPTKDVPLFKIPVKGVSNMPFTHGIPFYKGLAYAITTGEPDNDNVSTGAGDLNGTLDFHPRG